MTVAKLYRMTDMVRNRIVSILFQQISIPAQIFFSLILIKQYGLFNQQNTTYTIFYLGIAFFLLTCYNHFLLYSSILTSSIGMLSFYNLFIGFLNVNQKWKLYLFWFTTEYYFTKDSRGILDLFVIATCFFICVEIYRGLIFPTRRDNVAYFTGFFTLCMARIFKNVVEIRAWYNLREVQLICILPAVALLSFGLIRMRIKNLDPNVIKNPTIFTQYLLQLKIYLQDDENIYAYIFKHKKQCQNPVCFCHGLNQLQLKTLSQSQKSILQYQIINYIYIQFVLTHKWINQFKTYLIHKYIDFLIESDKIPRAMRIISEMDYCNMNYFNRCLNYRLRIRIQKWMAQREYFDVNRHKLREICIYDLQVGYITKEIREILFQKIQLWRELCKENPELKYLEVMGINIVERIQKLHEYFVFKLRPCQQILSQYKGTIIYATYLFLTTNYTQFAHSLAKKTQKLLEQSKSQTNAGKQYGLFLKIVASYDNNVQSMFELIITNVSSGFAELIGKKKQELLFKNSIHLIPQHFRVVYGKIMDQFINFNKLELDYFKSLNKSIYIPFKINHNQVVFLEVMPTLYFDMATSTMQIKCLLKNTNQNKVNFILDFNGRLLYSESQSYNEGAYDKIVKDAITWIQETWEKESIIRPFETTVTVNQNVMIIKISGMCAEELSQVGLDPLLHLEVKSEVFNSEKNKIPNFILKNRLKNLQGVIQDKQNDSQSSNSSRKQSVENVLTLLMSSSSIKTQICLAITLLLLLLCSVGIFFICNNLFTPWSSEQMEKSPIFTQMNLISMKHNLNKALSWNYDILRYDPNEVPTQILFSQLYAGNTDIVSIGKSRLVQIFVQQQNIFNNYILGQDNEASLILQSQLNKTFTIKNPSIAEALPQELTFKSIITNYIVDIFLLSGNQNFSHTLLSFSYLSRIYEEMGIIIDNIQNNLKAQFQLILRNNTIIICFATFLLLLFIIPMWKITTNNKKKYQRIYSLLASLETKLILDQIKKLENIEAEISKVGFEPPSSSSMKNFTNSEISSNVELNQGRKKASQKQYSPTVNIQLLYEGITKMTAEQMASIGKTQQNIKVRKRVGEVMIEGSNCDKKKIRKLDRIIVIFFLLFLCSIHALIWHKISYINVMNMYMKTTLQQISYLETSSIGLLNSKIYSDYYTLQKPITFSDADLGVWLRNWIEDFNSTGVFDIKSQTDIEPCNKDIMLCKHNFSQKTLQSVLKKAISNSYQAEKIQLKTNATQTSKDKKIRFQLYFAQQISDYLTTDKMEHLFEQFKILQSNEVNYLLENKLISIVFFIAAIAYSVFSIYYTIKIKDNYIREVTLLSILNKEMLYNNKRVESFLHQLSKNS